MVVRSSSEYLVKGTKWTSFGQEFMREATCDYRLKLRMFLAKAPGG